MKIFFSENTVNASYYSFGYSVYGYLDSTDTFDDAYLKGFQPCVLFPNPDGLLYMCRGSRVLLNNFKKLHEHNRIEKKFIETIQVRVFEKKDFCINESFINFCLSYFVFRHKKGSMPKERFLEIMHSLFLTHIVEYSINNKICGYMFEVHGKSFSHFWYQAYAKEYNNKNLGAYMVLDFILRAQKEKKIYAYLGATYGSWMRYKLKYKPLEYWDGQKWVFDDSKLKKLLFVDHMRLVSFTDAWRDEKKDFYKGPILYHSLKSDIRFLLILMYKTPKVFLILLIFLGILFFSSLPIF